MFRIQFLRKKEYVFGSFMNRVNEQRITRLIIQRRHVARMWGSIKANRVRRCYGKRQLGRPKRRWKNNQMMFRKPEWEEENCFDLAELRDKWRAGEPLWTEK